MPLNKESAADAPLPRRRRYDIAAELREPTLDGLKQIGAHIREARKRAFKESRVDFARRLGCTPVTLDRLEAGDPGVASMYLAAALMAMSVLPDVVNASSPKMLIASLVPITFPPGFGLGQPQPTDD